MYPGLRPPARPPQLFFRLAFALLLALPFADAAELRRGPYLQNQTESSVSVLWATTGAAARAEVEVEGLGRFPAESTADINNVTRHRARITGLKPDAGYRYRIRTGDTPPGEWNEFHGVKPRGAPIRFILVGDTGDADDQSHQRKVAEQMRRARPDFWIHLGDLVYSNYSETDFDYNSTKHFAVYQELNRIRPHYPTRGNHESTGVQFRKDFDFPASGAGVPEVYEVTYGDFWIASLSTGHQGDFRNAADDSAQLYRGQPQYRWLQEKLKSAAAPFPWKMVVFHRPTYNSAMRYSEFMVAGTRDITELCEDEGVDFIAFGHVHSLQRSKPIRRGQVVDAARGVVHLESGAGGAINLAGPGSKPAFHTDFIEGTKWGFLQVEVSFAGSNTTCTLSFIDEDGNLLNRWSKTKAVLSTTRR